MERMASASEVALEVFASLVIEVERILKCEIFRTAVALYPFDGMPSCLEQGMYFMQRQRHFVFVAYREYSSIWRSVISVHDNVAVSGQAFMRQ